MVSHWGVKGKRTIIVISTSTSICILQRAAVTSSRKELVDNEQINPKHYKEAWTSQHSESSFCLVQRHAVADMLFRVFSV